MAGIPDSESLTAFDAAFRVGQLARGGPPAAPGERSPALPASAGFAEAVLALEEGEPRTVEGAEGRLDRGCLESLLFRAWLFGVLTLLERRARQRIRRDPDWRAGVSPGRLARAQELKEERARRGRPAATIDALQFGDLGWLALRDQTWYATFGVESRRQARKLVKRLEALRNELAHGQDILQHDWDTLVAVARSVQQIREAEASR